MGHDHHFLSRIDRVGWADADLALTLYRDHALVNELILFAGAPSGADRIAISLRDPVEGPFVLVERNGHFVTCLAEGMKTDLHVIPRAELDTVMTDRQQYRHAADLLFEGDTLEFPGPVFQRGEILYREDLPALRAVQPALCNHTRFAIQIVAVELLRGLSTLRTMLSGRQTERKLAARRDALECLWSIRNSTLVTGLGTYHVSVQLSRTMPPGATITSGVTSLDLSCLALTGWWLVAQVGLDLLPTYVDAFVARQTTGFLGDALGGLVALAARYPDCRSEVRQVLARNPDADARAQHMIETTIAVLETLERYEDLAGAVTETIVTGKVPGLRRALEAQGLRGEVPRAEALCLASNAMFRFLFDPARFLELLVLATGVANCPAEQLCPSRELPARHATRLSLDKTTQLLLGIARRYAPAPVGARSVTVARNAPCPCGSGKKAKHCCGHGGPSLTMDDAAPVLTGLPGNYVTAISAAADPTSFVRESGQNQRARPAK